MRCASHRLLGFSVCLLAFFVSVKAVAVEVSGKAALELTVYEDEGQFSRQDYRHNVSVAVEPEFYWEWAGGDRSLVFTPFARFDEHDSERSHGDIRELSLLQVMGSWEVHAGLRKVFWGVTEFNHLVDVINQTDSVDSFDGEEKLGQPMLAISRVGDWGIADFFVLPGFRERTFAGEDGRLRSGVLVDTNNAQYESDREEEHVDFAFRWSQSISVFDVGVYWFEGTDRQPIFRRSSSGQLQPFYQQHTQLGVDAQATIDSWLLKLEAIKSNGLFERYTASQLGFEYTLYGVNSTPADVGFLLEYGWDERGLAASSVSQNDIYLGARFTLNDSNDSALLMGLSYDVDFYTTTLSMEASRRLNDRWTLSLEALLVDDSNPVDPLAAFSNDDQLQLTLERYF